MIRAEDRLLKTALANPPGWPHASTLTPAVGADGVQWGSLPSRTWSIIDVSPYGIQGKLGALGWVEIS